MADVVDAVAEQLSAFKAEAREREAACAAHAARAAEAAEAVARGGPDARAARNASAASANNADAFATPAFVSSARAADSRARAEATARRLAASVDALRDDVVAPLSRDSVSGFGSPPTPSSRAAAALESAEARSRGRTDAFGALPFSLAGRESDAASPAAVTAKSPRARKREWVK